MKELTAYNRASNLVPRAFPSKNGFEGKALGTRLPGLLREANNRGHLHGGVILLL